MKQGLRQRLVGAIVLLAIGAVLWPLIFDDGPVRVISKQSVIPAPPAIESVIIEPYRLPADRQEADFGPLDEEGFPVTEEPDQALFEPENSDLTMDAVPEKSPPEAPIIAEAPVMNEQGLPEAWSVQVGAFSNQTNALNLVDRLKKSGFKAYLRESQGIARVLIGPKLSKRAAMEDLTAIREQFQMQGRLVRYAP